MAAAKFLQWAMFWTFEKHTFVITFNPVGLAMPIPDLLDEHVCISDVRRPFPSHRNV